MTDRQNPAPPNADTLPVRAADLRAQIVALGDGFFEYGLIDLAQDAYIDAGAKDRILAVADHRMKELKVDVAFRLYHLAKQLD